MKTLLTLLLASLLTGCASSAFEHSAQAPRRARRYYRHAQRHHARMRPQPSYLPWN